MRVLLVIFACGLASCVTARASTPTEITIAEPKSTGLSVQTGYEGVLVPADTEDNPLESLASFASALLTGGEPARALASLLGAEIVTEANKGEESHKLKLNGAHGKPVFIPIPSFLAKHEKFPKLPSKFNKLGHLTPKKAFLTKVISKVVLTLLAVLVLFLFSGGIAASVCAFTPFCTISFLPTDSVQNLRSFGSDALNDAVQFVLEGIDKFTQIQHQ